MSGPDLASQAASWAPSWALAAPLATSLREVASDSSLLLLVGGLSMLCLIVVLVILQNLFPERDEDDRHGAPGRGLRPFGAVPQPTAAFRRPAGRPRRKPSVPPVDRALERVLELHLGEPRLLRSLDRFVRVRLYECRGCAPGTAGAREGRVGCHFERGGLEEAFQAIYRRRVTVRETICRCTGGGPCDFEVKL